MKQVLRETLGSLRTWPIFSFYILVTLGVAGIVALITFGAIDLGMSHFGQPVHRTHDVTYGLLFTVTVVGVLAQLRRPERNGDGMLMALVPMAGLFLAGLLSQDTDAVALRNPLRYAAAVIAVAALLHPAGRALLGSFRAVRPNWAMLGLVGVAAVPMLRMAASNIKVQQTVTDQHAFMGHYGFMAALSFTMLAIGVLASLRPGGSRLTAGVAGLLPALLGGTSLLYPDATSSLGAGWAAVAIVWGVLFVAAAAVMSETDIPLAPATGRRTDSTRLLVAPVVKETA